MGLICGNSSYQKPIGKTRLKMAQKAPRLGYISSLTHEFVSPTGYVK